MGDLTVLISGCGAPGTSGTVYCLRHNPDDQPLRLVGVDMDENAYGRHLCDAFHVVPAAANPDYIAALLELCKRERVDVVLPQNTAELGALATEAGRFARAGVAVCVSGSASIEIANDKGRLLELAQRVGVAVPKWSRVDSMAGLHASARDLGWPEIPVVVKPPRSNGMRGVRIVDESVDPKQDFFASKPGSIVTNMRALETVLGSVFPALLVMEYLPGVEYTVDVLLEGVSIAIPRRRLSMRGGITSHAVVERRHDIEESSQVLGKALNLRYAHGFQYRCDKIGVARLLEANPRVQGTMVVSALAGANLVYASVRLALGQSVPEFSVIAGTEFVRCWGGVGILPGGMKIAT